MQGSYCPLPHQQSNYIWKIDSHAGLVSFFQAGVKYTLGYSKLENPKNCFSISLADFPFLPSFLSVGFPREEGIFLFSFFLPSFLKKIYTIYIIIVSPFPKLPRSFQPPNPTIPFLYLSLYRKQEKKQEGEKETFFLKEETHTHPTNSQSII